MTTPFLPANVPLNNYPGMLSPYSNVTPFTDRDLRTFQHQLEGFIAWLNRDVIKHTDDGFDAVGKYINEFTAATAERLAAFTAMTTEQVAQYENYFDEANRLVNVALDSTRASQALSEAARDKSQLFAGQTVKLQDGAVQALLSDPSSASALVFGQSTVRPRHGGAVTIGDSISAYDVNVGHAWHKIIAAIAGKIRSRGEFATGGYTLEQIESTHLPSVLAMNPLPGVCFVAGGTNNLGATAGSTAGAYNPVAARATLMRIVTKLMAAGIMPVLWCPPPRDDSVSVNAATQRWNVWIKYTAQRLGIPYVDAYAAVADPATGKYLPNMRQDDVHPSLEGHLAIAQRVATSPDFLARFNDDTPHLSIDLNDAANMITAGQNMFTHGANGAGVPTNWAGYGGNGTVFTLSQRAAVAPVKGNWQRVTRVVGAFGGGGVQTLLPTGGFAPGDRVAFACRVHSNLPDSGIAGGASISVEGRFNGATVAAGIPHAGVPGTWNGIMYTEMTIPQQCDSVRINMFLSNGTGQTANDYVEYAQPTIVNLSNVEKA